MFNVRVKRYPDGCEQIQVFSHSMASEGERSLKKCDPYTGEILERKIGTMMQVPFFEEPIRVREIKDEEFYLHRSYIRTKKTVYDLARSNVWEWFLTFTFAPDKVDRYSYNECVSKMSFWLNNMKKLCPDMVYVVVPERHKDGAYHFHGLFRNCIRLGFHYSGKKDASGRMIFNVGKYSYGFTTATQVSDYRKASSYLVKYITKDMCAVSSGRKRYWCSRNIQRPVVEEYLLDGMEEDRIYETISAYDEVKNIKKVQTTFVDVTYIEV